MIINRTRLYILNLLLLLSTTIMAQELKFADSVAADSIAADSIAADSIAADSIAADTLQIDSIPDLPWPQSLQARLDTLIKKSSVLKTSQLGLMVYDLTADSVLYTHDHKQVMRPASTMKLITAITALEKLGIDHEFKTLLYRKGDYIDSTRVFEGDIYIVGGMDPRLSKDDMKAFADTLKALGIDTIRGSIYADKSFKDADLYGEGWCWDDDNSMLSALVFNRKDDAMKHFLNALKDAGIFHDGETGEKTCPSGSEHIYTRTHAFLMILNKMMKDSNNLYAEAVYYQIGRTQGKPSTAKKAKAVEEAMLRKIGIQNLPHRFADGSGLSLYNYVTAEMEVAFLRYAYNNSHIYKYLRPTLPEAGIDGTLEKRMQGTVAERNVAAKTGTLSGISSLAGYCTAANGHELAFCIINQGVMKSAPAKTFQDNICIALCK